MAPVQVYCASFLPQPLFRARASKSTTHARQIMLKVKSEGDLGGRISSCKGHCCGALIPDGLLVEFDCRGGCGSIWRARKRLPTLQRAQDCLLLPLNSFVVRHTHLLLLYSRAQHQREGEAGARRRRTEGLDSTRTRPRVVCTHMLLGWGRSCLTRNRDHGSSGIVAVFLIVAHGNRRR